VKAYAIVQLRLEAAFGPMPLTAIRRRHVAEFVASHKGGPSTIARDLSCRHAVLGSARKAGLIERNPAEEAERPPMPKRR
jgi:hypothetical protein